MWELWCGVCCSHWLLACPCYERWMLLVGVEWMAMCVYVLVHGAGGCCCCWHPGDLGVTVLHLLFTLCVELSLLSKKVVWFGWSGWNKCWCWWLCLFLNPLVVSDSKCAVVIGKSEFIGCLHMCLIMHSNLWIQNHLWCPQMILVLESEVPTLF